MFVERRKQRKKKETGEAKWETNLRDDQAF